MATLDLDNNASRYQIRAFKPGRIQVNDTIITSNIIITTHELMLDWKPKTANDLTVESFSNIANLHPDVLLIGTGSELIFISPALYVHLINQGIGVEVMHTRAACLTFNALASENRHVAAALIVHE